MKTGSPPRRVRSKGVTWMPTTSELKRDELAERAYLLGLMTSGLSLVRNLTDYFVDASADKGWFRFRSHGPVGSSPTAHYS